MWYALDCLEYRMVLKTKKYLNLSAQQNLVFWNFELRVYFFLAFQFFRAKSCMSHFTFVWNLKCPILELLTKKHRFESWEAKYKVLSCRRVCFIYIEIVVGQKVVEIESECEQESRQPVKQAFNRLPAASRACQLKVSATVANTRIHIRTALKKHVLILETSSECTFIKFIWSVES